MVNLRSSLERCCKLRRMPIVVVSSKRICSRRSVSSGLQMMLMRVPGRDFFMPIAVVKTSKAPF